jgi:hypothetical protein
MQLTGQKTEAVYRRYAPPVGRTFGKALLAERSYNFSDCR